jgi:Phage tail lysozyme
MTATLPTGPFSNAEAIYKGLLAMGLSTDAAAGVAGNIYQESHGNPSIGSGAGGGLFGETLANGGSTSGGSLTEQLAALAKYIAANGSISAINANASSPSAAAQYFMTNYERPNAALANLSAREAAAEWVAAAAKSGNWGTSAGTSGSSPSGSSGSGISIDWPSEMVGTNGKGGFFNDANSLLTAAMWLFKPQSWVRIVAFLGGIALLLFAIWALIATAEGEPIFKAPKVVPIPV